MGKRSKSSSGGTPPIVGLLKPAIGVAIALAGYYFMQGLQTEVSSFYVAHYVHVNDCYLAQIYYAHMTCCHT